MNITNQEFLDKIFWDISEEKLVQFIFSDPDVLSKAIQYFDTTIQDKISKELLESWDKNSFVEYCDRKYYSSLESLIETEFNYGFDEETDHEKDLSNDFVFLRKYSEKIFETSIPSDYPLRINVQDTWHYIVQGKEVLILEFDGFRLPNKELIAFSVYRLGTKEELFDLERSYELDKKLQKVSNNE